MAVNFFDSTNMTSSSAKKFGLCDDAPPATNPAYINETDNNKWIGVVNNSSEIEIHFHSVDHSVILLRTDGNMSKRCDGMLCCNTNEIRFVELKDRLDNTTITLSNGKIKLSWYDKGMEQILETIKHFVTHHPKDDFQFKDCYVCNKQVFRKLVNSKAAEFKNQTKLIIDGNGLIINFHKEIDI